MVSDGDRSALRNRRSFLKGAGVAGVAALAGCSGNQGGDGGDGDSSGSDGDGGGDGDGGDTSVDWTLGTSGPDSATHASGVAMSQVISEQSDRISTSAQTTQGTAANPRLIDNGDIDVAQSTSWAVERANAGQEPYADPELGTTLTQVLPFMSIEFYLIKRDIPELSDVETVSDIPQDGSISMAFGQRGGTNFFAGLDGFNLSGIDNVAEKYDLQSLSWGDQRAQLSDGRLDIGMGYSISQVTLTGWEQELDATQEIDVVEWEFTEEDIVTSGLPYEYIEGPADVWEQDIRIDNIPSVGVGYMTIFPASVSQEIAYEFVSLVHDNVEAVREASSVLQGAGPDLTENLMLAAENSPVHPGTEQFMREEDIWREDLLSLENYES